MRRTIRAGLLLLPLLLPVACASAPRAARYSPESFRGTWSGPAFAVNSIGDGEVIQTLKITVDADGVVRGTMGWTAAVDLKGHEADGDVTSSHEESVLGLASFTQGSLALVETEENGTLLARLLPDGTLEVLRTQPGTKPVVPFALLSRASK